MGASGCPETYHDWHRAWLALGKFAGKTHPDAPTAIQEVIRLWRCPVPDGWQRPLDDRLLGTTRDMRGPSGEPRGEHVLEIEILGTNDEPMEAVTCFGEPAKDGFNALPLARNPGMGGEGDVEADLLLLTESARGYRLNLLEVKIGDKQAFYALVETLRQLRLLLESVQTRNVFSQRAAAPAGVPTSLPVTAAVLARRDYYDKKGQKTEGVRLARRLIVGIQGELPPGTRLELGIWDVDRREITGL